MARNGLSLRIRKPNPASLMSFSTQAIRFLALFLKKMIPTLFLQPVCMTISVSSVTLFLRNLQYNSPVSIRFGRRVQDSKLFSSQTFDWTICPCRETRARGASVPQGNADRAQPLFGLNVATQPVPTCTLAARLACRHIPASHSLCCWEDLGALKDTGGGYPYCSGGKYGGRERNWRHGAERHVHEDTKKKWDDSPRGIEAMGCKSVVSHFQPLQSTLAIAGLLGSAQPCTHLAEVWEKWQYIESRTEHTS